MVRSLMILNRENPCSNTLAAVSKIRQSFSLHVASVHSDVNEYDIVV